MISIWEVRKSALAELNSLVDRDYPATSLEQEVDLLIKSLLGCENLVVGSQFLTPTQLADFKQMLSRRKAREPLQHILGEAYFYGLALSVGPGCFIPRPETEVLVEKALTEVEKAANLAMNSKDNQGEIYQIYDLCTGSGAIVLALMQQIYQRQKSSLEGSTSIRRVESDEYSAIDGTRKIRALAVEKSATTLRYTRKNLQKYPELAGAITLLEADAASFKPQLLGQPKANLLLCNPPYVAPGDVRQLEAQQDPDLALYGGGERGIDTCLAILDNMENLLFKAGILIMEHAEHQGAELVQKAREVGFQEAETLVDLTGADRFLFARGYLSGNTPAGLRQE